MRNATWILTVDHQHARAYSCAGRGAALVPVDALTLDGHLPASHEAGSHRPDLGYAAKGGPGHGYEPRTTPHDKAGRTFLDRVVTALADAMQAGDAQRLVLVAPPRALGELRARLPDSLRSKVVGELDRDLAQASPEAVREHLDRFLP